MKNRETKIFQNVNNSAGVTSKAFAKIRMVESFGLIFAVSILATCESSISARFASASIESPFAFRNLRRFSPNRFNASFSSVLSTLKNEVLYQIKIRHVCLIL